MVNEPNTMTSIWNAGATIPTVEKTYHASMGLRVFLSTESQNPVQAYFTVFVLQGKPALQRYLNAQNELDISANVHYIAGTAGQLQEGRVPGAMVNKDLFHILKFKRFAIGNTAYVGQGVTNINNTHREFYFKIRPKMTYRAVQGNAMQLTEGQMPVTQRIFLAVVSDEAPGDPQPHVWVNWVAVNKLDMSQ